MATIFLVNIKVGGKGWAPWLADEVIVFISASWSQMWPTKPFSALSSHCTQVLVIGIIFHKFLSTRDPVYFLAYSLVVTGEVGATTIIIKSLAVYCRWFAWSEIGSLFLYAEKAHFISIKGEKKKKPKALAYEVNTHSKSFCYCYTNANKTTLGSQKKK